MFTLLAAITGAVYFLANRPLKKIEDAERARERGAFIERIEESKAVAAKAVSATEQARVEAEHLKQENLKTQADLEKERAARLQLELALAPRVLAVIVTPDKSNISELQSFVGTKVVIDFIPDAEAQRATANLRSVLHAAGWQIVSDSGTGNPITLFDGVTISFPPSEVDDHRLERAAQALARFLEAQNWQVQVRRKIKATPDALAIEVGFKPNPTVLPPDIENALEEFAAQTQRPRPPR